MGTPLTNPEVAQWETLLAPAEAPRRGALIALLRAAPAAGHALRFTEFVAAHSTGGFADSQAALQAVDGLREHDVRYIIRIYEQAQNTPDTTNAPVLAQRMTTAVAASIARHDTPAQVATVIANTVASAELEAATVEGKSAFCFALFKLKVDSSKLGRVAASGTAPEDAEYVFSEKGVEVVTAEWKNHLTSRHAFVKYIRSLVRNARQYGRFGLARRIQEWWDWVDEDEDWGLSKALVTEWMEHYRCQLPVAEDPSLYLRVRRRYEASGGGPPPAALKAPSGALALTATKPTPPARKPSIKSPPPSPPSPPEPEPPLTPAHQADWSEALNKFSDQVAARLDQMAAELAGRADRRPKPKQAPPAEPRPKPEARPGRRETQRVLPPAAQAAPAPASAPAAAPASARPRRMTPKRFERYEAYKARVAARSGAPAADQPQAPAEAPVADEPRRQRKRVRAADRAEPPPGPPQPAAPPASTRAPPSPPASPPPEQAPDQCPGPECSAEQARDAPAESDQATAAPEPAAAKAAPAVPTAAPEAAAEPKPATPAAKPAAQPAPKVPGSWADRTAKSRPPNDPKPLPPVKIRFTRPAGRQ